MTMTFAQEQQVQYTIAIIQKTYHCSILSINEAVIRQGIRQGQTPSEIVTQLFRYTKES